MASGRRRAPLSDLSNLSPRPFPLKSSACSSSSALKSKPNNAVRVLLLQNAAPASQPELSSDDGGQNTAATPSPSCLTPSSQPGPTAMEVDACTPQATETQRPASRSSKEESFIIYNRRKSAAPADLIRSCPPPHHHLKTRDLLKDKDRNKGVKRGFSTAMLREDISYRSRRHSLPSLPKKQWLPEDFVAAQRLHFAEIDAFELSEEEGDLSDEG